MFSKKDVVFSYTTKDAVRDGVLIPIPGIISGCCGINVPVYFNDSVWGAYVEPLKQEERTARISDILMVLAFMARGCQQQILRFKVDLDLNYADSLNRNEEALPDSDLRRVELKSIVNAQDVDDPGTAIFIMLPWED